MNKTTAFFITGLLIAAALSTYVSTQLFEKQEPTQKYTKTLTDTTTTSVKGPYVVVRGVKLWVEVADTPDERGRGLSDRDMLPKDAAMLFVFETPGKHGFWMYRMRFPLDIIWIDEGLRVVYFVENVKPCVNVCETYEPPADALYVLEVNAGFVKSHGVMVGDKVEIVGLS